MTCSRLLRSGVAASRISGKSRYRRHVALGPKESAHDSSTGEQDSQNTWGSTALHYVSWAVRWSGCLAGARR